MARGDDSFQRTLRKLASEPLVHFFVAGALLFLAHRLIVGDPRTITTTPAIVAELRRRFEDQNGRKPNPQELESAVRKWERDEALFREALRERLDRDDPMVRTALVDKMRARAGFEVPKREPTDAELNAWLHSHQSVYETPLRYDFEFLAFPKSDPSAAEQRDKVERAISEGADPTSLGRPVVGGNLSVADMKDRIEPELAERIPSLAKGPWQRFESKDNLYLLRLKNVEGGLPSLDEIRARVISDWMLGTREEAIERIVQRTVDRYHFERRP